MVTERHAADAEEASLVRELAAGSEAALGTLYDRYGDAIFAAAYRLTSDRGVAEEVVQETFLTLWNRAELFDPNAGSLSAWLHTIGRNRAVDRLRAAGRRPQLVALSTSARDENETQALERAVAGGTVMAGATQPPGPEEAAAAADVRTAIRNAVAAMPELERMVILLAYQEELSQTEIADRLAWPLGTVKTRTRRALLRLREALGGEYGPSPELDALPVPTGKDR